ncbi:MAG: glycosyltransferase family 2 protein [bacterium]
MKKISIVSPCYNEEENLPELIRRVRDVMGNLPRYDYELIFIDNCSRDGSVEVLKRFAAEDEKIKIIVNARNYGYIRSPYYGLLQCHGDAVIMLASDLQDPPEMIWDFIVKWEEGARVVVGIKTASQENPAVYFLRGLYYKTIRKLGTGELLEQFTGFGLYDRSVVDILRGLREPYPYFRGLISDVSSDIAKVEFEQPARDRGQTKSNFYSLFDIAMLGFTNHTKIPLRLATLLGFIAAGISLLVGIGYLVAKLLFWNNFTAGMAPVLIGLCFIGSLQLFFLGVVGEYVGAIFTYVQNRPLVVEKERINFDDADAGGRLNPSGK